MQEREVFLSILSDYLHNRPTCLDEGVGWSTIIDIAKRHQLTSVILEQCAKIDVDASVHQTLVSDFARLFSIRTTQERIISDITSYLEKKNTLFCVVKGSVVAQYYQQFYHRSMGDVDIVVQSDDREKLHQYFMSMGFNNKSKNLNHEWVYTKGVIAIELHDKLIYPEVFNKECEETFFNNIWRHVSQNQMEPNFHFVYLIYHLKKHLTSGGAGFRQFFDLCLMLRNCTELNKATIIEYLEEAEMIGFAKVVFSLCARWFKDESLYFFNDNPKQDAAVLEAQTDTIFRNGVFGQYNDSNKINVSVNNLRFSRFKWISKLRVILMQLFPSYHNMIATSNYAFLEHRPYLLPIAWVYRFFVNANKRRIKAFIQKKIRFASSDEQKARERDLKQWGII